MEDFLKNKAADAMRRQWWGLIVAYLLISVLSFLIIWAFLEPAGVPNEFTPESLPSFLLQRIFLHIYLSLLVGAFITMLIELFIRRDTWVIIRSAIRLQKHEDYEPLEQFLADANKVDIIGINLAGIVSYHQGFFIDKAKEGCEFRFILTDPALTSTIPMSSQTKRNTENAFDMLNRIMRKSSNIQLGLLPFTPVYSLLIKYPNKKSHGTIQVEIYSQIEIFSDVAVSRQRPHLIITQNNDRYWYDYFCNEFLQAWESSTVVVPSSQPA